MRSVLVALALVAAPSIAAADDDDLYLIHHPDTPWWLSGQVNLIWQGQPGFHSPYESVNLPGSCQTGESCGASFQPGDHHALSFVATIYGGYQLTSTTAIVVTGESAGGSGLSAADGLAGFTNLDVVRNPALGWWPPYVGRAYVDQVIPLSSTWVANDRNPLHVLRRVPERRIEIRAGKMGMVDWFDTNSVGTDSHLQFMNWTIDNNGAYDYAADTRGYTLGAMIEYVAPLWALRYGIALMPTVANGIDYDFDIADAHGQQLELELHECLAGHPGIVRLLGYQNSARMGNYDLAIAEFRAGETDGDVPDIRSTRLQGSSGYGRTKTGYGVNVEQELTPVLHAFARVGWNDGQNESFAYTEVDNTVMAGFDLRTRASDKLGVAAVSNGISSEHQTYLELGGNGFLLGDGKLSYGREDIFETYYTTRVHRGIFPSADVQLIAHPGYNTDRGPVVVGSLRLHVEI